MSVVLITGASGGLGRAMADECAARGYDLFLTDIGEKELMRIRQGIVRQYGVAVHIKACDLTDAADATALFEHIDALGLRLGMLLNIAGVDFEGGFMDRECVRILDIVRLNIEATLRVTHAALLRRAPEERFHIVMVSSLASLYPIPLKATYAASKRFLLDFSIALGQELKKENVNVLALCPGGLPTTKEALLGIAAQGLWGVVTTHNLGALAQKTIARVLAGKPVYIPGPVNQALSILGRLVPRTWVAKLLYNRWHAAQRQWLAAGTEAS